MWNASVLLLNLDMRHYTGYKNGKHQLKLTQSAISQAGVAPSE